VKIIWLVGRIGEIFDVCDDAAAGLRNFHVTGGIDRADLHARPVLPHVTDLVKRLQKTGAPVIYFGTDSATLLPSMQETGAEVIGLDWRIPLDTGWHSLGLKGALQGNLDPVLLFADWKELKSRAENILRQAAGRPGHIFNLGHGILPETPVDNVKALCDFIREHSAEFKKDRR